VRHRALLALAVALIALLLVPATASALTYDGAVDKLVKDGYPQKIHDKLVHQVTSDIGFCFGGSTADLARGTYLVKQFAAMGIDAKLEIVPIDATEFKGASVTVGDATYVASTFGGVRATPEGGLTGELVYVGGATAAEVATAGDLGGKIVIIDALLGSYWMNWQWTEAALAGAAGIIYTGIPDDDSYFAEPESLGSFDAEYRYSLAPVVYISQKDGLELKAKLDAEPGLEATMVNDVDITLKEEGGKGYNVVATIPGSVKGAGRIVVAAHKDSYFHAALDDLGGVVCAMTMAKAIKMSGYKPARTITFLFTTGEEYGAINAYYDWLIGAWHAITKRHPGWAGTTALMINLETMAMTDALMETRATPEVKGTIDKVAAARPALVPNGYNVKNVNCWNDQWTFTAAGVPSIYLRARTPEYGSKWYHSNYDTLELMDYEYMGKINKFTWSVLKRYDKKLLPYDLTARAADLAGSVDGNTLKAAGASVAKVDRLEAAIARFTARAAALKARAASIPPSRIVDANRKLMAVEKVINKGFTALDAWDDTVYPHAQAQWDLEQINLAIAALEAEPADPGTALDALRAVGVTDPYALDFGYENYTLQLEMHKPGWYGGLFWGGQGQLSMYLDVVPAMNKIDAGMLAGSVASITVMRDALIMDLNKRIDRMSTTLDKANAALPLIK
jgi:hypothetical protein